MSGMTDQEAMNTIDAYLPRHCRAALDHIAARLRGESILASQAGAAGVPETWQPIDTAPKDNARPLYFARFNAAGQLQEIDFDGGWDEVNEGHEAIPQFYWDWVSANGIENPTHWAYQDGPPPAPVAGEAVWSDEAAHAFRCAADAVGAHWYSWPDRFRAGMKAALAQDRAAQGAAPSAPLDADARLIAAAPALLEACETFAEWLRREDEGLPAGIERGAPDGERRWREWWNENLRICALAQEQARAAIRQATEGEGNE